MAAQNILDLDVMKINTPLLIPKKYIKEKNKKTQNSIYKRLKKQVLQTFDKFQKKCGRPTKLNEGSWYGELKNQSLMFLIKYKQR